MTTTTTPITSVTFQDGRTMQVGDRVRVCSKYMTRGWGTIVGLRPAGRDTRIQVQMDADVQYGAMDRWPLREGGEYNRPLRDGLFGGEIYQITRPTA